MDKLKELISKCKAGVYLTINDNRNVYQSVEDKIKEINERDADNNRDNKFYEFPIDEELSKKLIKANCIYEIRFYPITPIGFYTLYGCSLEDVTKQALEILKDNYNN